MVTVTLILNRSTATLASVASGARRRWWPILAALAVLALAPGLLIGKGSLAPSPGDVAGLDAEVVTSASDKATVRAHGDIRGRSWSEDVSNRTGVGGGIAVLGAITAVAVPASRRRVHHATHQALLRRRRHSVCLRAPPLLLRA